MIYCSATVFLENVSKSGPDFARESESDCRQTLLVWKRFFFALFVHLSRVGETIVDQSVSERAHWYPKDGELCLSRMKPEETLVEVRSGVDVQITQRMIRGVGNAMFSAYSQTSNGQVKVPDIGAHEIPEKVLVDIDSRTVAMEVGIRQGVCNNSPAESTSPENG
ncbi:hypothetical protein T4B_7848 [Trichinella pseudospiralis]|uniref:Uncharacterized protein n=1 Tax=Trichinella pseudospiralis TaxID=6337 RepID=A0A0V1H5Z3_TRIPS|nr:hypothetical protein T4B_7848 [Trichinella pseudospiralis]